MFKRLLVVLLAFFAAAAFAAVDANTASPQELDAVKGIGAKMSAKIVDARKTGPFKDWDDMIGRVKGIGKTSASKLSTNGLTVNGAGFAGAKPAAAAPAAKVAPAGAPVAPAPAVASAPAPTPAAQATTAVKNAVVEKATGAAATAMPANPLKK